LFRLVARAVKGSGELCVEGAFPRCKWGGDCLDQLLFVLLAQDGEFGRRGGVEGEGGGRQ